MSIIAGAELGRPYGEGKIDGLILRKVSSKPKRSRHKVLRKGPGDEQELWFGFKRIGAKRRENWGDAHAMPAIYRAPDFKGIFPPRLLISRRRRSLFRLSVYACIREESSK